MLTRLPLSSLSGRATLLWAALAVSGCGGSSASAPAISPAATALLERGRLWIGREQYDEAIAVLTEALASSPDSAEIYFERGVAHERAGNDRKALDDYGEAIRLRPDSLEAQNNKAAVHARRREFADAAEGFRRALEIRPDDTLALRNRGLAYHDLGRYDDARADFRRAIKLDPASADPWFLLGNVSMDAKDYDEAVESYSAALKLDPLHARAWANRAAAYSQLGHAEEAKRDDQRARAIEGERIPAEEIVPTKFPAIE